MILNAKCHAIRDTQLLEKDIIRKEQEEEEKRLDHVMEVDRQNAIVMEEEIEKKRKEQKLVGAMKIMEQIEENEKVMVVISIYLYFLNKNCSIVTHIQGGPRTSLGG